MSRTTRALAAAGLALAIAGSGAVAAAGKQGSATAKSQERADKQKPGKTFVRGARSLGDPLFPQIGNGGYDARSYTIELDYDPAANVFNSARTTLVARATQNLASFSLDFQDLDVSRVTVNGREARFRQREATPDLSDDDEVTQPMKLIVKPRKGLRKHRSFTVKVHYSGQPNLIVDADLSIEGWIPACRNPGFQPPCDGAHVVNQPIGAQSWFPSNNYPTDKAAFDTFVTVPNASTAFGIGELASRRSRGGKTTWHWHEDDPTSTYLTTATVGEFDFTQTSMTEDGGRTLPVYNGIDSDYLASEKANVQASLALGPGMLNYLRGWYGPYPLDSTGAVVDDVPDVGYALEVQTKSHFSRLGTITHDIADSTLLHEIAHQWVGNTVTLAQWPDIWFNEGWATWSEWIWGSERNGEPSPAKVFDELYADPDSDWEIAPAVLDGDPANLFAGFPVYDRGAMIVQGTREIIGEPRFRALIRTLMSEFRYGNISSRGFIAEVKHASGFGGARLALLSQFLEQWIYGETKPTILPEDFS